MTKDKVSYPIVKPLQLQNESVKPEHEVLIQNFVTELKKNRSNTATLCLVFASIYAILSVFLLISSLEIAIFFFILALVTTFMKNYILNFIQTLDDQSNRKVQYGTVLRKFSHAHPKRRNHYYADIFLPNQQAILSKVSCEPKDYLAISEGVEVLAVTFDQNQAFLIPLVASPENGFILHVFGTEFTSKG